MASHDLFAGVELGGTKCVALLARGPDQVLARETLSTTSPEETLDAIEQIIWRWRSEHDFRALGVASFGPVDLDKVSRSYGAITNTPKRGWSGAQVLERLARAAAVPTSFDTDVNGAALAEMRWGAGRGVGDFAYITVGTGVGVGLIVNGMPTRGFGHCELGHIRVARRAGDTFAGVCPYHGDCVEGLAAGPAVAARAGDGATQLQADDPVWDSIAWPLAQLCHAIVCASAPLTIAIGGGVAQNHPHLLSRIERLLVESLGGYVDLPGNGAYVRAPELGADAGPLGAIALAMRARS